MDMQKEWENTDGQNSYFYSPQLEDKEQNTVVNRIHEGMNGRRTKQSTVINSTRSENLRKRQQFKQKKNLLHTVMTVGGRHSYRPLQVTI